MEGTMMRRIFAVVVGFAGVFFAPTAQAYEAPWCAVIEMSKGSVYWDCQYRSFEDCYRRGNILAGNRGFCNSSPYYVGKTTAHRSKRRASSQ
jgi:hypothetical protein